MMDVIKGKDVLLEVFDDTSDAYVPFICAKECGININPELINKTTLSSGRGFQYKTRRVDWDISLSGITTIVAEGWGIFKTIAQVFSSFAIRMRFEDEAGNEAEFSGTVLLKSATINAPQEDFSSFENGFQGSGLYNLVTPDSGVVVTPDDGIVRSDWWETVEGETSISGVSAVKGLSLVGKQVLEVSRSGDQYDIVTTAPGNRQAKVDSAAGTVEFENEFNEGETVFVLFK